MAQRYSEQGLLVVAVNLDKERALASSFLHDVPANFTIAYDPDGKVADSYQVEGMPSSYLIDRQGNIAMVHLGFRKEDSRELERALKTALGQ